MTFNFAKAAFMIEILVAELIFLFPAEKRPLFPLRYAGLFLLCIVIGGFFPIEYTDGLLAQFLMFFLMFLITVGAMALCFSVSFSVLISCCVAGYAVEHIAFHIVKIAQHYGFLQNASAGSIQARTIAEFALFPPIYLLFFLTVGLYTWKNQSFKKTDLRFHYLSFAIVFICIGLTRIATYFGDDGSVTVSLYAITACLMALVVQLVLSKAVSLKKENDTIRLLWQEDRRQFALSKATIDTINIKYHDLKHKLSNMNLPKEEVDSIKDAVRVYGSRIRTGNEALDVLLTENSLRCGEQGITLTYTGNGADFSFMNVMDVYSLFGNAVSNAVEAVQKLSDPEKKVIDILSERRGEMINVTVTNFFSGTLQIEDGVPVTSKAEEQGFHGFGVRSMQLIAEKYGGHLQVKTDGDLFILSVYLMQA